MVDSFRQCVLMSAKKFPNVSPDVTKCISDGTFQQSMSMTFLHHQKRYLHYFSDIVNIEKSEQLSVKFYCADKQWRN